jgi:hypothetical protein
MCKRCSHLKGNTYGPLHSYGDSFNFICAEEVRTLQETLVGLHSVMGILYFLCVENVRTSQETHIWNCTNCCGNSFTFLYIDNNRTSQETQACAFTACYWDCSSIVSHPHHFPMQATFSGDWKQTEYLASIGAVCLCPRVLSFHQDREMISGCDYLVS